MYLYDLFNLCYKYSDIFYLEGNLLTSTEIVMHKINIPRYTIPINIRSHRLPWAYQEEIENHLQEVKKYNIIRNSITI